MAATTATTALIYGLIFGAQIFSFVVGVSRLTETSTEFMSHLDWSPTGIMALILVTYLLLGAVMESFAVMVITVPIVTPLVQGLGYDILWWGIINICVVETGLIHPPLGLSVFVLKEHPAGRFDLDGLQGCSTLRGGRPRQARALGAFPGDRALARFHDGAVAPPVQLPDLTLARISV